MCVYDRTDCASKDAAAKGFSLWIALLIVVHAVCLSTIWSMIGSFLMTGAGSTILPLAIC